MQSSRIRKVEDIESIIQNSHDTKTADTKEMTAYYQGISLEEWALTDTKCTNSEIGISWHVRDRKYPYMTEEDAQEWQKLCEKTGEFYLKEFAKITGLIQQLDENTVAFIGDNGIGVTFKNGKGFPNYWKEQLKVFLQKADIEKYPQDNNKQDVNDAQNSTANSNIIIKPDGTRVLMVTVKVGNIQTTMNIELSKPTDLPNDSKEKQMTNNKDFIDNINTIEDD